RSGGGGANQGGTRRSRRKQGRGGDHARSRSDDAISVDEASQSLESDWRTKQTGPGPTRRRAESEAPWERRLDCLPIDENQSARDHPPALGESVRRTEIIAGPTITAIIAGNTKRTSGNRILIDAFCASSSACIRRCCRNASELERNAGPICAPSCSLWTKVAASGLISSTAVRSASPRN